MPFKTLKSDFLTQGPMVAEFEKKFAQYVGADHAVAVSNGTAALHLSVAALDLKAGQRVITTPISFAATSNCVLYNSGKVDFADIDPNTGLIDLTTQATSVTLISSTSAFTIDGTTVNIDSLNNRVGIGIATPATTLHVRGDVTADAFIGDGALLTNVLATSIAYDDIASPDANSTINFNVDLCEIYWQKIHCQIKFW